MLVAPLENGDRLTREEFERRWDFYPQIKRAELIDGQVYLERMVTATHGEAHASAGAWAGVYRAYHAGAECLSSVTVRLGMDDLQPDVSVRVPLGGTSVVSADDCIEGPPEFVFEIAMSSASYDLHVKKRAYERGGVLEYVVWQQYENRLDWFALVNGRYETVAPDADGIIESRTFAGLRLDVPALLCGDPAAVLAAVTPASA